MFLCADQRMNVDFAVNDHQLNAASMSVNRSSWDQSACENAPDAQDCASTQFNVSPVMHEWYLRCFDIVRSDFVKVCSFPVGFLVQFNLCCFTFCTVWLHLLCACVHACVRICNHSPLEGQRKADWTKIVHYSDSADILFSVEPHVATKVYFSAHRTHDTRHLHFNNYFNFIVLNLFY